MKKDIHPQVYTDCVVTCACGNKFTVGSTVPEMSVEVCSACHPFYTGQMKYVDTAGRVDAFRNKQTKASAKRLSKTEKRKKKKEDRIKRELDRPDTLEELRKRVKGNKKN